MLGQQKSPIWFLFDFKTKKILIAFLEKNLLKIFHSLIHSLKVAVV